jgi:hypothetical protein
MPALTVVRARPVIMSRIGWTCAGFVLIVFVIISLVMRRDSAGASFGPKDQVGTAVLGVLLAAGFWLLTRPRLEADTTSVRLRSFAGNYRTVPWEMIKAVEFPSNVRFARLVLPGDESFAIYAVQRLDGERAVQTMKALRELFASVRPR